MAAVLRRAGNWALDGPLAPLVVIGAVLAVSAAALAPVLAVIFAVTG